MSCIFRSDEERQVFLTQVDHVFLAIRGDAKFSSIYQQSFTPPNSVLREIEVRLTEVRARAMSTTVTTEADGRDDYDCLERFDYQRWTEKGGPLRGTHSTEGTSFTLHLSEESVLKVFELICCSPEASETVTSVALSALIALAELESFFTPKGVEAVIEIAYKTRSEITDMRAFEVLLYRINVLLLACVQHPNAANCNEKVYITVLNHVLTTYFEASSSPLLRRTAEAAVETTVRVFFERQMSRADSSEGAALVEFVGQMVRGEILGFQSDGNHITKNDPEVLESLQKAQRNSSEVFGEVPAIQLAGLRLATTIVTLLLKQLRTEEGRHRISNVLVSAVQDVLARALLIAGVKCDHVVVLSEVVHVTKLFSNAKLSFFAPQVYNFLTILHIDPLLSIQKELATDLSSPVGSPTKRTSPVKLLQRREILLKSLASYMSDASFVAYCFSFFFLSWRFDSVIPKVFDLFKSVLTDNTLETGSDSLKATVSTALVGLLQSLRGLQVSAAFTSEQTNFDSLAKRVIQEKDLLSTFSDYFNDAPLKKGVAFLLQNAVRIPIGSNVVEAVREHKTWFILEEPAGGREIGACLFRLSRVLDKRSLGNYIGDLGREDIVVKEGENPGNVLGTVAFYNDQLQGFMHQFDFAGKSLLDSTREMVYSLCLPGEAQKIDRVMECFANHWYAQNSGGGQVLNPFRGSSGCFILAFAMIMLNTDQHSPSVKNRMTFQEFVNMNRGIDDGESLPEDYLRVAYDDIKGHEIIMAEMMFKGFENNISWHLEMCTTTRNKYDCALAFIQVGEGAYVLSKPLVSEVVSSEFLNLVRPALLHANDILTRNEAAGGLEKVLTAVSGSEIFLVFRSALQGMSVLLSNAASGGNSIMADEVMETLLGFVSITDCVALLQKSVTLPFMVHEILCAIPLASKAGAVTCWSGVAQLLLSLFSGGVFRSDQSRDGNVVSVVLHGATETLPEYFLTGPPLVLVREESSESRPSRLLSSFFGRDRARSEETERAEREKEVRSRLSVLPDMVGLLNIVMFLEGPPLTTCIRTWCDSLLTVGRDARLLNETSFFTLFLCNWMRSGLKLSIPATIRKDFPLLSSDHLLPFFESLLTHAYTLYEGKYGKETTAPNDTLNYEHWAVCLNRMQDALLFLMSVLLQDGQLRSLSEKWISPLLAAPPRTFSEVVLDPLSDFILQWAYQCRASEREGVDAEELHDMYGVLLRLTLRVCDALNPYTDRVSYRKMCGVLYFLVSQKRYDRIKETELVVNTAYKLQSLGVSQAPSEVSELDDMFTGDAVDVLRICCGNVSDLEGEATEGDETVYYDLWRVSLQTLCTMFVRSTPEKAPEVYNAIQHSLGSIRQVLSPEKQLDLYTRALLPLLERLGNNADAGAVPNALKCRVVSLIPKVALSFLNQEHFSNPAYTELWKRLLGTMYAVYTSYTVGQTANKGDASMTESIEEAVKNVVLVIGADLNNSNRSNSEEAQTIRKFISMLVKPFPFAEPLLSSLTSGVSQ